LRRNKPTRAALLLSYRNIPELFKEVLYIFIAFGAAKQQAIKFEGLKKVHFKASASSCIRIQGPSSNPSWYLQV